MVYGCASSQRARKIAVNHRITLAPGSKHRCPTTEHLCSQRTFAHEAPYREAPSHHEPPSLANHYRRIILPELHGDLFSRHASPLEVCVFVMVDERSEDVMSDEIGRRCNGKQQRRRRGGRSVQLPDWVMNKIKRQHIAALTWVTKMKSLS